MTALIVRLAVAVVVLGGWPGVVALAESGEINALVRDPKGEPVPHAVVVAVPRGGVPAARPGREVVDQINKEFVPYVKALLVGSPVDFPNKDNIRHHVYSFSPAKTFELPLYMGTPARPVVFDRPGVVTIGCNIHDWMIGHIYVAESPYVGTTGRQGRVKLENVPPGVYAVRVWHPNMDASEASTNRSVTVDAGAVEVAWQLTLTPELVPRRAPVPGQRGYR
jgi:plastocyanin